MANSLFNINQIIMSNREIKLQSKKLHEFLKTNESISEQVNKKVEEWKKVDAWVKKQMNKQERIKEKMRPLIADLVKEATEIGEFEVVGSASLKKNEIVVNIIDLIELRKEQLRAEKGKDIKKKVEDKING